jgi:multiple sugar transport system substrate-binding protein
MKTRVALVAVAALALSGCGGGGSGSSSSSDFAPLSHSDRSGRTLKIYGFGKGDDVAANRFAVAKAALSPATILNPDGAYDPQQFLTKLAAGNVPDLVYLDRQQIATLAAKHSLQPIDQCLTDQDVDRSLYRQAALDEASYNGKLYALPEFTNQRTLIVDEDVIKGDVSTTNWDRLKTVAKQATQISGGKVTRIGFDPKIPEFFIMWAHANGVDLLSADGKTVDFDDPKAVEALAYTKSLIDEQGGWTKFKSFRDTWDFFGANNQVQANQVGAWPMESWYWNVLAESSPDVHVKAVPFTDRQGNPFTFISGNGWAIPAGAKNPSLACSFMKAITSTKAWVTAAKKRAAKAKAAGQPFTGLYTANIEADERILDTVYQPTSPQWDAAVKTLVDVQDNAISWPSSPAGARVQQALTDAINRVLSGQQSPKAALAQAQTEAQNAIDSAGA